MDKFNKIVRERATAREAGRQHYLDQSRERLRSNMAAKIRTVMIGSLARVEEKLGHLWGHGKLYADLSDREVFMRGVKDELRTEILNHGNNLLRAAMAEIDQYKVEWTRYQYEMEGIDENSNNSQR
jgi:hypothetical protein